MEQKLIKTTCKNCGNGIEQDGKRSMKRCSVCGIKWMFRISERGLPDLYQGKRVHLDAEDRKTHIACSMSRREMKKSKECGFSATNLAQAGYCLLVLGMGDSEIKKLYNKAF